MKKGFSLSICIPVYKGSHLLKYALDSIFKQGFDDYEIIIGDDNFNEDKNEIENTKNVIKTYNDNRLKYHKNKVNLGYAKNLKNIVNYANNDIVFLMAQDDILSKNALSMTHDAFLLDDDIGVVTRPYFWFMKDISKPVRVVTPYDHSQDTIISIENSKKGFLKIFESVGQLSGLAYQKKFLETPFHEETFPAHIYPFAGILKKHKCVFLKEYTVAVGIIDSQTRAVSSIYDLSPTLSWLKMYNTVFGGDKYKQQREWGIEHITTNYMGLVQLKNYAKPGVLSNEIKILIANRKKNLISPLFWFFVIGVTITPRFILIPLVDWVKDKLNSKIIKDIKFNF